MRASRGFTLIELMVVMVIISVLIGLAVLSTGFASTSRELTFELDGQPLVLAGSKGEKEQKKGTDQPQLLILSSGELSPFRLRLAERGPEGRALSLSSDGFRLPRVEVARR